MKVGEAIIDIRARMDKLEGDLKKAERKTKDSAGAMSKSFKGVALSAKAIGAALATVYAGAKFISFMRENVRLANEQEKAERKLSAILKSTGNAAGFTSKEMFKYAAELQKVTTYGDEVTISAMAIMATFKEISGNVFKRSIKVSQDLATIMGTDLKSAVVQVGKALNAPVQNLSALSRAGIQFTKAQSSLIKELWNSNRQMEAQQLILEELESQFGGSASAVAETFGGKIEQIANAWGDYREEVGKIITQNPDAIKALETIKSIVGSLTVVTQQAVESWSPFVSNLATAVKEILDLTSGKITAKEAFLGIDKDTKKDWADIEALGKRLVTHYSDMAKHAKRRKDTDQAAHDDWKKFLENLEKMREKAREKAKLSGTNITDYWMPGGRKQLATQYDEYYKAQSRSYDLLAQKAVDEDIKRMKALASAMPEIGSNFEDAKQEALDFSNVVTTVGDGISDAFTNLILGTESVADSFKRMGASIVADMVKIMVNQLIIKNLMSVIPGFSKSAMGNVFSGGNLMAFARGGIVGGPTVFPMKNGMGLMGEAGPEAVMPLTRTSSGELGVKTEGSRPSISVNIINNTGSEASVGQSGPKWNGEEWVLDIVLDAYGRNRKGMRNLFRS